MLFIHVSDTHVGFGSAAINFGVFISEVSNVTPKPRFIVNTGDVTDGSQISEFLTYQRIANLTSIPLYTVVGNHDAKYNKTAYQSYIGELYYSFDFEGFRFIVLDSTVVGKGYGHVSEDSIDWLHAELSRTQETTPIVVFSHHPLIEGYCNNGDYVLSLFEPYNIVAFFSGHAHVNGEILRYETSFISTSSLGKSCPAGYRIVTANSAISTEFVEIDFLTSTAVYFNLNPNPADVGENVTLRGLLVDEFSQPLSNETIDLRASRLNGLPKKRPSHITFVVTNTNGIFTWSFTIPTYAKARLIFAAVYLGSETYQCSCNFALLIVQ